MRITHELLKPFEIEADSDQYTLLKIGTANSGKNAGGRVENTVGYYTSLDSCLRKIVKEQILVKEMKMVLDEYVNQTCQKLKEIQSVTVLPA